MRRRVWVAVSAVTAAALFVLLFGPGSPATTDCTRIQGFSQTNNWTHPDQGGFMPRAGFEVSWVSGSSLRSWTLAQHDGWSTVDHGECGDPTVLVQQISGPELSQAGWEAEIVRFLDEAPIPPTVESVELVAVVGSAVDCDTRASRNHPTIVAAIGAVVADRTDAIPGPALTVSDCSGYADSLGHLTLSGAQEAAAQAAAWWDPTGDTTTTTTTTGSSTTTEPATTTTTIVRDPRCSRFPNHPACRTAAVTPPASCITC